MLWVAYNNKCKRHKSSAVAEGFPRVPKLDIQTHLGFKGTEKGGSGKTGLTGWHRGEEAQGYSAQQGPRQTREALSV